MTGPVPTGRDLSPAVAVAVVTSRLGVLVGRRRNESPPWVFLGSRTAPGESPEYAAMRGPLEETGLRVRATGVIAERVHPRTGVLITYVAAGAAGAAGRVDAVAASEELIEVRWVDRAEARNLMGDMHEPVRKFLHDAGRSSGDAG